MKEKALKEKQNEGRECAEVIEIASRLMGDDGCANDKSVGNNESSVL